MTDAYLKRLIIKETGLWGGGGAGNGAGGGVVADVVTVWIKTRLITQGRPLLLDPDVISSCTFAALFLSTFSLLLCLSGAHLFVGPDEAIKEILASKLGCRCSKAFPQRLKYISRVGQLQSSARHRSRQTFRTVFIFPFDTDLFH